MNRKSEPRAALTCWFLAVLVSSLFASCTSKDAARSIHAHLVDCPEVAPSADPNADNCIFNWQQNGPLEFLAFLQTSDPEGSEGACWVTCKHVAWVKREDVARLLSMLDSQAKCRKVYASRLSPATGDLPTVGLEALVMLESYRAGCYPALDREEEPFAQRRAEFLEWWKNQQ